MDPLWVARSSTSRDLGVDMHEGDRMLIGSGVSDGGPRQVRRVLRTKPGKVMAVKQEAIANGYMFAETSNGGRSTRPMIYDGPAEREFRTTQEPRESSAAEVLRTRRCSRSRKREDGPVIAAGKIWASTVSARELPRIPRDTQAMRERCA